MLWQNVFTLMWGVPLMTLGMGLSAAQVGVLLTINTLCAVVAGPIIGIVSARVGRRRDLVAISLSLVPALAWFVFLSSEQPRGWWAIVIINVILGATTPVSSYGFDTIREQLDRTVLAAGTGLANMGGFVASMAAAQLVGVLLDVVDTDGGYDWGDFRIAYIAVFIIWGIGMVGFFIARLKGGPGRRMITQLRTR